MLICLTPSMGCDIKVEWNTIYTRLLSESGRQILPNILRIFCVNFYTVDMDFMEHIVLNKYGGTRCSTAAMFIGTFTL